MTAHTIKLAIIATTLFAVALPACGDAPPSGQDTPPEQVDADQDGVPQPTDCNDHDATVYPGAPELADGLDNDCNGAIDDGVDLGDEADNDDTGDATGDATTPTPPAEDLDHDGYTTANGDCDDQNPAVAPGLPDDPDGLDNDCDGLVDEPCDKVSSGCVSTCTDDYDGDGFSEEECDCHDGRSDVFPGNPAPDLSNGLDEDCDGQDGEDDPTSPPATTPGTRGPTEITETPSPPPDLSPTPNTGTSPCAPAPDTCNGPCDQDNDGDGYTENQCDCDDMNADAFPNNPRADYPDGIDTNCDGTDGESCGYDPPFDFLVFWPEDYDNDGDGYTELECDCRDDDPAVYPGSTVPDIPDGTDDDCDGLEGEDEGWLDEITPTPLPTTFTEACSSYGPIACYGPCDEDDDGDGFTEEQCDCADFDGDAHPGYPIDYIDGVDNDCDGVEGEDGEDPQPFDPSNQHPPTAPDVAIQPENPSNTDDLNCVITRESHDLEGNTITYAYQWRVNGLDVSVTSPTVSHESTTIGQTWTCLVTPSDGVHLGDAGEASAIVTRKFYLDMRYIVAGTFVMGSPGGTICQYGNESQHTVTLTHDYWMGTTEVTQAQFEGLMGFNPSSHQGCDDCPVEFMTWHQAAKFTNELSRLDGIDPCYTCSGEGDQLFCAPPADLYTCQGYRLPTEAEWEYAARAGETADFLDQGYFTDWDQCDDCFGALELSNGTYLGDLIWYCGNATESMPEGSKPPNALGLYDMQGNIWEWCEDWWDGTSDYSGDAVNPVGAPFGDMKAARGGSWTSPPGHNSYPYRAMFPPTTGFSNRGFRIVGLAYPGEDASMCDDDQSTPAP